ncbi:hypothetical protein L6452_18401 [Arctium lappa]|uniref:Uncharacterized protein n=1 Tax=Arctium lappa TaxID=4217 RepID=A0ACB9C5Z0_ARCLA|nr:hypothetical protein L6452_18401 [Arctium lappa]
MTSRDALSIGTDVKPPILFKGEYEQWKDRFLDFFDRQTNGKNILTSITKGPMPKIPDDIPAEGNDLDGAHKTKIVYKDYAQFTAEQKSRFDVDKQAISLLLQSMTNEIYVKIYNYNATAKSMWDQLRKMMLVSKVGNQMKVANCINNYEEFMAKVNESLEDTYERFVLLLNELSKNKVTKKQIENNVKFLSILQPEWKKYTHRMKQMKDLSEIPLHEVVDPIALVAGEKEKEKKEKKIVMSSSESESESDGDDGENLKQAILLLTRAFQKKLYKKSGSNSQRYSSSSSKNHEHGEKVEGNRFVEKNTEEKKSMSDITQKIVGSLRFAIRSTTKKMLLAKQQDAGKELMVEDEYWLDHYDVKEEPEETAHLCLMGKEEKDDETTDEVMNLTENDFMTKMETMMVELQGLQTKLKKEKDRFSRRNQHIFELNKSVIGNKDLIDSLRKFASNFKNEKDCFESKISELQKQLSKSDSEKQECVLKAFKLQVDNKTLEQKVNGLEAKLYIRGQTDQTIFLNTPNEQADVKEKWGLGYDNPH